MLKAVCLILFVAFGVFAFQQGPSKEVRARLFRQIMSEDAELRDCLKEQQQDATVTVPSEDEMSVEEVDFNRDGVKEYEVQLSGICACGAHNCTIYLYRRAGDGFESILEGASGLGIVPLQTSTNGYRDLKIDWHNNAATVGSTVYKFDGKQYQETKGSTITDLETGQSKPASRRVQFQRGSSSATVRGKASITLPDTYLIGARSGQTMTVQLTAPRKSVRFLVMTPKLGLIADNSRGWSGVLPENGDYTIIVDADEVGGTYSMTITIK